MKIRCDVCDKVEASVFCSADEAALCHGCDHRVHHANKLANKHLRFSLLHPPLKEAPLCDICQERRALLFCQEDRAILCRECDLSIHKANEHTQKHNRFLLTGVQLSSSSSLYHPSSSSPNSIGTNTSNKRSRLSLKKKSSVSNQTFTSPSMERTCPTTWNSDDQSLVGTNASVSTSSISEYLENLPGWRVDDFLDPCQNFDHSWPMKDQDLESDMTCYVPEDLALWVPQVSPQNPQFPQGFSKNSKKWSDTDKFSTVPQLSPSTLKRPRCFPQ